MLLLFNLLLWVSKKRVERTVIQIPTLTIQRNFIIYVNSIVCRSSDNPNRHMVANRFSELFGDQWRLFDLCALPAARCWRHLGVRCFACLFLYREGGSNNVGNCKYLEITNVCFFCNNLLLFISQYGGFLISAMFSLILMSIYIYAYKDNVITALPEGIEREVNNYRAYKNDPFSRNNVLLIDYIQNNVSVCELI